jgi:hypothetical protein
LQDKLMPQVVAIIDDLMFLSRVREAARGLDLEIKAVRRPEAESLADAHLVLVDLDRFGDAEVLARVRSALGERSLVGFLSHVQADRARLAREAGCTRVLARSAFVQELPALLSAAAGRGPEGG